MEALVLSHDPAVTILTETWLNDSIYDSELVPSGYSAFRKDRDGRGGGVSILFKTALNILRMPNIPNVEGIFCKAYYNGIRYIIGAIYRPPNTPVSMFDELDKYLRENRKTNDRIILSGDFNLPNIHRPTFTLTKPDLVGEAMLNICFTYDLLQVVQDYTKIQGPSKSVLDLFFVSGSIDARTSCEVLF